MLAREPVDEFVEVAVEHLRQRVEREPLDAVVVECQDERSQHKNRARALSLLKARLLDAERSKQAAAQAQERRLQVGSGDRSQRIRTWNFPQGRITDHRVEGLTLYSLPQVLDGDLDELVDRLAREHQADELKLLTEAT